MRPDDVRRLLRRVPFEPFRICLLDGSAYDIRHPDQVFLAQSTLHVAGSVANLPVQLAQREVVVALLHISRLEPLAQPHASAN